MPILLGPLEPVDIALALGGCEIDEFPALPAQVIQHHYRDPACSGVHLDTGGKPHSLEERGWIRGPDPLAGILPFIVARELGIDPVFPWRCRAGARAGPA